MEAILKCEIIENEPVVKYSFHCRDKNQKILSSAVGYWTDIEGWIENDVLLQGVCKDGYEPPPTTTTTTTTTKPPSCDYLKSSGFDLLVVKIIVRIV